MSGFGNTPVTGSQGSLPSNQFPLSSVAVPGAASGNLTALEGGPASTDTNGNSTAPASMYVKDGLDVTQGVTTDAAVTTDANGTVSAKLRGLVKIYGDIWDSTNHRIHVDGSGVTQPISAASLPLPTGAATSAKQPALGTAGSASSDVITVQGIASMTALKVDGSGVTQPVSGTITANVGTTNGLALDTSVNGVLVAQASTTSGQSGPLVQGAVTTSAPTYTTAKTSPISLTTAGAVRVDASATTQPVSGTFWQTTQPVSGTVSITANSAVNVAQVAGTTTDTNSGTKSAGTQRIVIATDQPALTNALKVDGSAVTQPVSGTFWQTTQPVSGTVTANAGTGTMNVSQQATGSGSATLQSAQSGNNNGTSLTVLGYASVAFTVTVSSFTGTVNFEGTEDNSNWSAIQVTQLGTNTIGLTTTGAGTFVASCASLQSVRARTSGVSGGNVTVTGHAIPEPLSFTAINANQAGTWNITNISGTVSLPTGAATSAKQPALGTAGTASSDVISVQGIASMTALKVDGSGVTQPVSGTVTANAGTNLNTSSLALETGGNLATLAGGVSSSKYQANITQVAGGSTSNAGQTGALQVGGAVATNTAVSSATNPLLIAGSDYGGTAKIQSLKVDSSGNAQVAVTNTPAVSQSGTWTVQPGNTANTTPWLATINQGGNSATVASLTNSKALAVEIVDGSGTQVTSFGGSNASVSATGSSVPSSGTYIAGNKSGNLVGVSLDGSGNLNVNVAAGSGSGFSATDEATWTAGTTPFAPIGGAFNDSAAALTSGQEGTARVTANRAIHVNLRDGSANQLLGSKTSANSVPVVVASDQGAVAIGVTSGTALAADQSSTILKTSLYVKKSAAADTVLALGSATSANSVPVVIASDQGSYGVTANITLFGGNNVATGTGAGGNGIPRVTVSNDSEIQLWDGTNGPVAVKAAQVSPALADKALTTAISPNNSGLPVNLPTIIQNHSAKSSGSVASLAQAFTSNNIAGNSIIVVCGVGNGTAPTISDTSNTYTQAAQIANGTAFNVAVFYAVNIAAGANTVTVNNGGSTASIAMEIYEVSGFITQITAQPDQTATNSGNSGTASTSAIAASSPNEFAFAAVGVGTAAQTITAGSGWTNDSGQQNPTTPAGLYSFVSMSQFLGSLKAVTPQATFTTEPWAVAVASFRPVVLGIEGTVTANQGTSPWTDNITQIGGVALALGQTTMSASIPVAIASNQSAIPASQSGTWTMQPGNTANTTPWLATINQGGNSATVTGSNALKVDGSAVTQPVSGTVSITANSAVNIAQVASGNTSNAGQTGALQVGGAVATNTAVSSATNPLLVAGSDYGGTPKVQSLKVDSSGNAQANITQIGGATPQMDNTHELGVSLYGKHSAAGDTAVSVDSSGNVNANIIGALPAGSATIGAVTQASGPWTNNVTQFGGVNISTGTGASGTGIPRVTVSNDSEIQLWDGTNGPVAVKAAATSPAIADKAITAAISPNNTGLPVNLPVIVQKTNAKSSGSVASLALAFGSNNIAGNSIIVVCGVGNGTAPTISDTNSNTYTQIAQIANGSAFNTAIFLGTGASAGNGIAVGANTVTVNNGGSTASIAMEIYEVSGFIVQVQAQPDQTATNTGNSGTASTPTISASSPNELAFAAVGVGTGAQTITVGSGWTNDSGQQNPTTPAGLYSFVSMSQFLGSLKAVTPQATFTSEPWAITVASFRPVILGVEGTSKITDGTTTMGFGSKTSANSMPVVVASDQGAVAIGVASGTALAADQSNTILKTSLYVKKSAAADTVLALGSATSANSVPVVIASDQAAVPASQSGTWTEVPNAATSGGSTPNHTISASGTNSTSLKGSAGQVYGFSISNSNAAARFFKLYNKASAPTIGTDTPVMTVQIPASGTVIRAFPVGLAFATGIGWGLTTGIADSDTGSVGTDISVDIDYK